MEILKRVPFLDRKWVVPQVSKRFAEITSIPSAVWDEVDITLDRSRYQHTKPLDLPAAFKDVTSWLAKRSLALADPAASASRAGHSRHRLKVADDRCEFLSHSPFANLAHNWPCLHTFVLELYPQVVCPNSYDEAGGEWQIRTGDDDEDMGELPAAMSRLVSLERLVLRFCGISGLALPSLAKLPRLHTLELQELHRLTWPDMEEDRARLDTKGIGELTSLRCLNFRNEVVSDQS
ncbi:hypothetical protein WJX72_008433 [[Myrmecia] bisecta]|uniref:Uncharacterized protein n=1 Tax=[Myrmecia] bisecta TaxID=41462 RepID=A0AAW1Q5S7_9CHLO